MSKRAEQLMTHVLLLACQLTHSFCPHANSTQAPPTSTNHASQKSQRAQEAGGQEGKKSVVEAGHWDGRLADDEVWSLACGDYLPEAHNACVSAVIVPLRATRRLTIVAASWCRGLGG